MLEVNENANQMDKIKINAKQLRKEVEDIREIKLNHEIFYKKVDYTDGWIDSLEKRLKFQEHESLQALNFVIRHIPLMFNNVLVESFNSCLNTSALELFQ